MDRVDRVPVTFDGGLWNKYAVSAVPENALQAIRNYELTRVGGLLPRRTWTRYGTSGAPTSSKRAVRGMTAESRRVGGSREFVVAMDDATDSIDLYVTLHNSTGTAFSLVEAIALSSTERLEPVKFAMAEDKLYYSHHGETDGRIHSWDGATAVAVAVDDIAGRSLTYHLNRMWSGGPDAEPTHLYFSSIGDSDTWNLVEGFLPVGKNDGGEIRETCVFDRTLLIGKENGIWILGGSTLDTFQLYPLNRFLGVARGRSMLPTERGVFIVNEKGVWLWDGASFDEITTPLDFTLSGAYATMAFADGKLWVQDNGADFTWVTDGRAWWQEDSRSDDLEEVYAWNGYLYAGLSAGATTPLFIRQEPGTARGGVETGGIVFNARTVMRIFDPKWNPSALRSVWVRYRQLGPSVAGVEDVTVKVTCFQGQNGLTQTEGFPEAGTGLHLARCDFALVANGFDIEFEQLLTGSNGSDLSTAHMAIEEVILDFVDSERNR